MPVLGRGRYPERHDSDAAHQAALSPGKLSAAYPQSANAGIMRTASDLLHTNSQASVHLGKKKILFLTVALAYGEWSVVFGVCTDSSFLREQAARCRSLAENAD
jgi:hypothetical protein